MTTAPTGKMNLRTLAMIKILSGNTEGLLKI